LDVEFKETGKLRGPLHGIPITLKDQFNVKGVDTTLGYVGRSFCPAQEDAALVRILRNMGAIIIAKTNLPQSIMVCRSSKFPILYADINTRLPVG
jgi:amidase